MSHSLVGVLRDLKPRRALLTTYTFNPAFFEAAVLPAAFRPDGCQISVLVDGGPLAASTFGSFAQHIGSRYAVAPVRAPNGGIFHPKIALLDADDRQVLCVGSGNLTASGLAHQLETLDISELLAEPALAEQTRAFLCDLAQLCRASSPRAANMLLSASGWIRTQGEAVPGVRACRLIHTLAQPAGKQMRELLRLDGREVRRMTVLAPFHSADGSAVIDLRQGLGHPALRIAHLGTVPSGQAAYGDATYVSPCEREPRHPLHAKVFEFETDDGVLVVSGSVNATMQSLHTTKNVEVSVARYASASPFAWEPTEPASFVPQEQVFDPPPTWSLEASLVGSDRLEGFVVGEGSGGAQIAWALSAASGELVAGSATLEADGLLTVQLPSPIGTGHEALMLHIAGQKGISARAWVNDERALRASRDGVRLSARSAGDGEVASDYRLATDLILRALAGEPIHGRADTARGGAALPADDGEAPDEVFDYEQWVRSGHLRRPPGGTLGRRTGSFLSRVLNLLFPQPEVEPEVDPQEDQDGLALGDADPNDEDGEQRVARRPQLTGQRDRSTRAQIERQELLKACQAVRTAFESGKQGISSAEILASAVCALDAERAQTQFLTPAANELGAFDAHRVLVIWLDSISRYEFDADVRSELLPMACAMAAATAAVPARAAPQEQHLSQLRSSIGRLAGRTLTTGEVAELVQRGMRDELMLRWDRRFRDAALAHAAPLAEAPSLDDLLRMALDGATDSRMPQSMEAILAPLARWIDRRKGWAALTPTQVRSHGCPICYLHFKDPDRRELAYQRWMLHGSGRPHVLVYPDDINRFR